jgi:hypothetical protein
MTNPIISRYTLSYKVKETKLDLYRRYSQYDVRADYFSFTEDLMPDGSVKVTMYGIHTR